MANSESLLQELLEWYKAVNYNSLKSTLIEALPEKEHQVIYELTRPDFSSNKVSEKAKELNVNVGASTIRNWQSEWLKMGLVREVSYQKREAIFELSAFGINVDVDVKKLDALKNDQEK